MMSEPANATAPAGPPAPAALDDDEVDVSLIRWTLSLTPSERLAVLQGFVDSVAALRHGAKR